MKKSWSATTLAFLRWFFNTSPGWFEDDARPLSPEALERFAANGGVQRKKSLFGRRIGPDRNRR